MSIDVGSKLVTTQKTSPGIARSVTEDNWAHSDCCNRVVN